MKKFLIKSTVILSIMAMLGSSTAYADDSQELTENEMKIGLCFISGKIAQKAMAYRQSYNNYTKKEAQKELYKEFITDIDIDPKDTFGSVVNGFINGAVETSYKEPVVKGDDEKLEAVNKFATDFAIECTKAFGVEWEE